MCSADCRELGLLLRSGFGLLGVSVPWSLYNGAWINLGDRQKIHCGLRVNYFPDEDFLSVCCIELSGNGSRPTVFIIPRTGA
jgi:hypothetical protein